MAKKTIKAKAKRTARAAKARAKQNSFVAIAMQPVAFAAAIAGKITAYFK